MAKGKNVLENLKLDDILSVLCRNTGPSWHSALETGRYLKHSTVSYARLRLRIVPMQCAIDTNV